ncbi:MULTISPECIES: pirin family protein [unclassified Streptomyces]|uniref:pirin family protein n=1 Tax=unclassified Streptomyces TaxID=2593676 RepID=UPI0022B71688|nr:MULTISPECIES: pirin family protein [unclassified Streptomyces]MCZ7414071.1 pirin family protein [Streptomyces sp. WMMC897]MCZ7431066.1 pirin family protein [Streptomyces sp. WMMC1477]
MLDVRRAADRYRGGDAAAGIDTRHAFSFSGHYDPDNTGFGLLVACNEERLAAGAGFAEHPHRDLEIVTWVTDGELTHTDSAGHRTVVRPGDLQRLSAGAGVRHAERNEGSGPLRFWQMWLVPDTFGGTPEYEVVRGIADGTPYALDRSQAVLHVRRLPARRHTVLPAAPWAYLQVVRGSLELEGSWLAAADAARVKGAEGLVATAGPTGAELLVWEMHAEPSYG